jgi:hypothetical protein
VDHREVLREVRRGWFLGGRARVAHRTLREMSDTGQLVTGAVPGSEDGRIVEGTLLLTRDTRDNTILPSKGQYHQVGLFGAAAALGSDFGYAGARLDPGTLRPPRAARARAVSGIRGGTPPSA